MAFTLPSNLSTSWVDNSSTITASDWNNIDGMSNALKAAIGTWGYSSAQATVAANETTNSATYTDLTTTTDTVTAAIGSSGTALVYVTSTFTPAASAPGNLYVGYAMSGANTASANDTKCLNFNQCQNTVVGSMSLNAVFLETGLTPGFTTFKLKYRSTQGAGVQAGFSNRRITVIPFPSTDGTRASATVNVDASSAVALGMSGAGSNRPTYDSVGGGYKAGGDTGSWSHTIGANAKALLVTVFCTNSTAAAVTVDGSAMTKITTQLTVTTGGTQYIYVFGMLNPPTGTKTIAVTGAAGYLIGNSVSYNNVAGFGAVQTTTGAGTSVTQTLTPTAPGRIFFHAFGTFGNAALTSYSGNERWSGYTGGSAYPLTVGDVVEPSMSAVTVTATNGNTNGFGGVAVELIPSVPTYSVPTWVGTGQGAYFGTNPGTSWVETVPADASLALLWMTEMPSDQSNTCTVTLGGTTMVEVTGSPWTYEFINGYNRIRCFALLNPTTGPGKTVAVTSNVSNRFHAHMVYYGGVTSLGPAVFTRGTSGATLSTSVPNTLTNHMYAQAFAFRPDDASSTYSGYSGGTQRAMHNNASPSYTQPMLVGDTYGNGGTLAFSTTRTGSTGNYYGSVTIDLSPSALPTPSTPTFVGLGAGRPHTTGNFSWTETVPANATCAVLWVSVMGSTAISATLGGQAMTAVGSTTFPYYSGNYTMQVLYLMNPPTGGGKTLSITNANGNNHHAVVTYYAGVVGVANAPSVSTGAAAQQPQMVLANTTSDHLYANMFAFRPAATGNAITGYDQNRRIDHPCNSYDLPCIVGDAVGNGGTLTFNGTRNDTTYEWGGVTLDLSPTAGRSASVTLATTPALSFKAWKPLSVDAYGGGAKGAGTSFDLTWSHTVASDANLVIMFVTKWYYYTASGTFQAKLGSTNMTAIGGSGLNYYNNYWYGFLEAWAFPNPPSGAQTMHYTWGGNSAAYCQANSVSLKNVGGINGAATSGFVVASGNGQSTTQTRVVSNSAAGDLILQAFTDNNMSDPGYTGYNQNFLWSGIGVSGQNAPLLIGWAPGSPTGADVTFSVTKSTSDVFGGLALDLKPISANADLPLTFTPAITMDPIRNRYSAEVNLPFMPTIGMSAIGPVTDTFVRANSGNLGANWTNRINGLQISSNTATLTAAANCVASYNTPAAADDVTVQVVLVNCYWDSALFLGCNTSGTGAMLRMPANGTNGFKMQIFSMTDWATGTNRAEATVTWTAGDVATFTRVGNVYTAYQNGVQRVTWTDSGNVITRDSSHRLCGLGGSASAAYPQWSNFGIMPF